MRSCWATRARSSAAPSSGTASSGSGPTSSCTTSRGYGRDSFLSDGATPVTKAYNIVGPTHLIEGPDRAMYGVSDEGLWRTADGVTFDASVPETRRFRRTLSRLLGPDLDD